jgi:hypothetical protein
MSSVIVDSHSCQKGALIVVIHPWRLSEFAGQGHRKIQLARVEAPFPAVSGANPVMEELVGFLARNLETHKAFARDNGLVALTAVDRCCSFHNFPQLCRVSLVGTANFTAARISVENREFSAGA